MSLQSDSLRLVRGDTLVRQGDTLLVAPDTSLATADTLAGQSPSGIDSVVT
ncbi:MAG: hypothetical protein IT282_14160, partial [Bacteroidetes bacterium]|nr:hypothetical protein [Bacteroidota bacterium]